MSQECSMCRNTSDQLYYLSMYCTPQMVSPFWNAKYPVCNSCCNLLRDALNDTVARIDAQFRGSFTPESEMTTDAVLENDED